MIHIPLGCMYLCQPMDVRINNKMIKTRMRENWEYWMLGGSGVVHCTAKEWSRELVAESLVKVYVSVLPQIGRNGWMKKGVVWV